MAMPVQGPLANLLLGSLPPRDFQRLEQQLKQVVIGQGTVLHEPEMEIERVTFPQVGMISLLAVMRDGKAIETATIGREGALGAMAALGLYFAQERAVVQLPLTAWQITAAQFRKAVEASAALRDLAIASYRAQHAQVQATAACNALHPVEARLCRWILQSHDRNGADVIPLTQEFLSQMLGVRRSSVGEVARRLQDLGLIRYSRGGIEVTNRKRLEAASCECYRRILGTGGKYVRSSWPTR